MRADKAESEEREREAERADWDKADFYRMRGEATGEPSTCRDARGDPRHGHVAVGPRQVPVRPRVRVPAAERATNEPPRLVEV